MISIQGILVPVDFSEESILAAKFAVSLAREYKTKVYVLHVSEPVPAFVHQYVPEEIRQNGMNQLRDDLSRVIPCDLKESLSVEEILEIGRPVHHIIVKKAQELGVDVIIIATHGRTGLAHGLLGSVAEHVIRYASCPVFVIRNPKDKYAHGWE